MNLIPHSRPFITKEDIRAVTDVLESRFIGRCKKVNELESYLESITGQHAICTGSGRAAIMFAMFAGGDVWLPTYAVHDILDAARWAKCSNIRLYDLGESGEGVMYAVKGPLESEVPRGTHAIYDFANHFPEKFDLGDNTAIFSFGPLKPITGGHGGAVSRRGIANLGYFDLNKIENLSPMTDINAALVLSQLKRSPPVKRLITVDDFDACEQDFLKQGIIVRREVRCLIHQLIGLSDSKFPKAMKRWNTTVSVPNYPDLTIEERERIDYACRRYSV